MGFFGRHWDLSPCRVAPPVSIEPGRLAIGFGLQPRGPVCLLLNRTPPNGSRVLFESVWIPFKTKQILLDSLKKKASRFYWIS